MIKALIFDFDGLILDTESPEYTVWNRIYAEQGQSLPAETWGQIVGGYGASTFDPARHLQDLTGRVLNLESLRDRHRRESDRLTEGQLVLPGVLDYLQQAQDLGLKLAIASSSPHSWVDTHLTRLGLFGYFSRIICADDVPPGRTKPHPDLFIKALEAVQVQANQALVFEDSPNGIRAARAAGIFVVAVPNPITKLLEVAGADLYLDSLAELPLPELLARFNA